MSAIQSLDLVLDFKKIERAGKQIRIPYREGGFLRINCCATNGGDVPIEIGQEAAETMAQIIYEGLRE